jgi:glycolate oxidase iron-sulfur subunit
MTRNHPSPLGSFINEISRCVHCGLCAAVCPSYRAELRESYSPRGRIALITAVLREKLPVSDIFTDRLASCMSCLACEAACPCSVPVTSIIQAAKEEAVVTAGTGILERFVRSALVHAPMMKALAWLAPFALRYAPRGRAVDPIIDIQNPGNRQVPVEMRKSTRLKERGRIAFYPGCAIRYFQQDIGRSAVAVLTRAGYEITVLDGAPCCGRPLLSLGDRSSAQKAARENLDLFGSLQVGLIVTACASCGLTFKKEYPKLAALSSPPVPRVVDIHEVLAECGGTVGSRIEGKRVTWHDPCHLGRGQGLAETVRAAVRTIAGIELVEMEDREQCCGFGGMMRISHHRLSNRIGAARAEAVIRTGAEVAVTGCPGCRMQLSDALARAGSSVEVVHTVQLMERGL